ncbi:MAG: bifunctional 4-hydroxy-2-oxoglutarate aldolase/2-dehydro-3-deoxy-phosphogluconate aldolase [Lachnospiraceae bacterium]|nr:bifunctional 4-hydroxy-2-oxoglutarate aldolase/2-dehydro-3-deoxy-phosphogluconate aldolase [Lachnospiraceae bacterium]
MRETVIREIEEHKLIVIARGVARNQLAPLGEALYEGGVRFLEITYQTDGSITDDETEENIRLLSETFCGRLFVGAGTVLTPLQVERTARAGGTFVISPDTFEPVIRKTRELGLVSIPGAMTPSEIQGANRAGADFVKLFPASALGAAYVKDVLAPLSGLKILAVGNIHKDDMREYLNAGVCGFGVGSAVVDREMIRKGDFDGIRELAGAYVNAACSFRRNA